MLPFLVVNRNIDTSLDNAMKVTIRNPVKHEIEFHKSSRVHELLNKLNLNPESHLVIRRGELLTNDDLILEEDQIEILSSISGG